MNSPHSSSPFYNLQMYSSSTGFNHNLTSPVKPPLDPANRNPYQPISEVPYHQIQHHHYQQHPASTDRQVQMGDIVFTNPFSSTPTTGTLLSQQQGANPFASPMHSSDSSNLRSVSPIKDKQQAASTYTPASAQASQHPLYAYFGEESVFVTCPYCHQSEQTDIEDRIGSTSLLCCLLFPIYGLFWKSRRDIHHRCRNCLNVIAVHYPDVL